MIKYRDVDLENKILITSKCSVVFPNIWDRTVWSDSVTMDDIEL